MGPQAASGASPSRSQRPWALRSPASAAPGMSSSSGLSAPRTSSTTPRRTSPTGWKYDVVHDNVGNRPLRRLLRALTPTGILVTNAGGSPGHVFGSIAGILRVVIANRLVRQRLRPLPDTWTREHLLAVIEFVEGGDLTPIIDRTYPLADTAAGLRHLEQGHARGKVVVTVT